VLTMLLWPNGVN